MVRRAFTLIRRAAALLRTRWRRWLFRAGLASVALAVAGAATIAIAWALFPFPREILLTIPASPIVTARDGQVLAIRTTPAGEIRIPVALDRISPWLPLATIAIEDERFRSHPGVDPAAVLRAAWQNVCAFEIVSGASTITMQLCNLLEPRPRGLGSKLAQSLRALQLERILTKEEILAAYLNLAPYGGNLRGVEAAARRYFAKSAADLSLGEAALLAGLPQAPSRYRPDRHPQKAADRRATVLRRMRELGIISAAQHKLALAEPVITSHRSTAAVAPHAVQLALHKRPAGGRTTIDTNVQRAVETTVSDFTHGRSTSLPPDADLAVVVLDIESGDILALVGSANYFDPADGQVNGAVARRSPGSALKPFIYAAAFEAGRLGPESVVYDIPIERGGWSPQNFDRQFAGPLPAAEALRRSLNVPAILVAEGVGVARCVGVVESAGVSLPRAATARGGLALAVGGLETTLLDLTNAYATIGRRGRTLPMRLFGDEPRRSAARCIEANTCSALDEILSNAKRTPNGASERDSRRPWFMWKTGTSAGRRDAWAVGHNRRFAIGVWVGRFNGVGHPAFVGGTAAEPLLAALFGHPLLRVDVAPRPATPWVVTNPLGPPKELQSRLRILAPHEGAAFVAVGGSAVIRPRVAGDAPPGELAWFLNGWAVEPAEAARMELRPAGYELRCVGPDGRSDAVRFVVRDGRAGQE